MNKNHTNAMKTAETSVRMECNMRKGDMKPAAKTYSATLEDAVIIVKNVPTMVCNQCGEVVYSLEVATVLESIVDRLAGLIKEVAIVEYSDAA